MSDSNTRFTTRLFIGLCVIALGVLFTLDNLGYAQAGEVLRYWPALLVVYGITRVAGLGCRPAYFSGTLFIVAGSWMLMHRLGLVHNDIWQLWPLVFVFMGIGIIRRGSWGQNGVYGIHLGRLSRRRRRRHSIYGATDDSNLAESWGVDPDKADESAAETGAPQQGVGGDMGEGRDRKRGDDSSRFSVEVFMSSVSRKVTSQQFKGGEVVCFMGGGDIDMRSARMAEGTAQLEINLVMGGVNLFVPEDWAVEFQGTPIMGGVEDHSRRPAGEPKGRLVITGVVLMSSIEIKN